MHQNIFVLTLQTLNGARLGPGHFANKKSDLLGARARAGVKGGDGLQATQLAPRLLFSLSVNYLAVRFTRLHDAGHELQHPGTVAIAQRAHTKLFNQHQFIRFGVPRQHTHGVTALKQLPAHGCGPTALKQSVTECQRLQ